jgi:hypothetical protein
MEKDNDIKKLKIDNESLLEGWDNDRLILYIVNILETKNIPTTFDKIVVASFLLFPKRFSLIGFSEYPDAKRVHDCLFHCTYKTKKWIEGGAKQGYKVSEKGMYIFKQAIEGKENRYLNKKESFKERSFGGVAKRKERAIIDKAKKSKAYDYFISGKIYEIDLDYLKEALRCTPDASKEDIADRYRILYQYAKEIGTEKLFFKFLEKIKERLLI